LTNPISPPIRHEHQKRTSLTDTNAASDSKGRTWGLEGGLFWWLIGGIGAGIIVFFVLLVVLNVSLGMSFPRRARAGVGLPRLHLRVAAGQAARLRPRHVLNT
jgi:hypothetical protein